nr:hemicentin-2-like isoform X7 [Crassostrea gigas]XP_034303712.1 hemicentin-2-like isoform X7 [Crassostrea gigas]
MKQPMLKLLFSLTLTMLYFPTFLNCDSLIISEVNADTCITFNKISKSTDPKNITRNNESLCAFIGEESFPKPTAWNRAFSCRINISNLSVCFSDTTVTDAGVFHFIAGNVQENTTLEVEYPPSVSLSKTQKTVEGQNFSIKCSYSPGNPTPTSLYWTKTNSVFRYNGQLLRIPNIGRKDSGTYTCFAENTYSSGRKGKANVTIEIDVQYPPVVSSLPDVKHVEGDHVQILCKITAGNPASTSIFWTKSGYSGFRQSGSTLVFTSIKRSQSGVYTCVAENNYLKNGKGIDRQSFQLSVLYGPTFIHGHSLWVSEGQSARMSTSITSNPASNVSWFRDNLLVSTQQSVNGTTSYTIPRTQCTDTGPFQVVASNGVQSKQSTKVFLYVYCSPRLTTCGSSVEVTVDDEFNLNGQISVLSYPQPNASLALPSGALNTIITLRIDATATNFFTITLTGSNIQSDDFGTYLLNVANQYGRRTIHVNITFEKSSVSTSVVVGGVLGGLLFLAVCAIGFLSYKYFSVKRASESLRSYETLEKEKAIVDNHTYEPYTCDEKADVEEIQKISKSNPFKLPIFNNSRKERKKKCPTLETLNQAKTKESPLTKIRFTKTKKGKKLYENAEELAATACDQNKGNSESKKPNDIKSRNIKETKSKPLVLPKPKKQLSKASKAFSYF